MNPTSRHHVADLKAHLKARTAQVGGCWIWQRGVCGSGYPKVRVAGKVHGAHRLA